MLLIQQQPTVLESGNDLTVFLFPVLKIPSLLHFCLFKEIQSASAVDRIKCLTQLYGHQDHLFPLFYCTFSHISYHYCSSMTTKVPLDSNTSFPGSSFITPISTNLFLIPHSCSENCANPLLSTIFIFHLKGDFFFSIWQQFGHLNSPLNGEFLSCCLHADSDQ